MGRVKGVGRRHKNGTGHQKAHPADRKLTERGHKHTAVVGTPKPPTRQAKKRAAAPSAPVEEPPCTGEHRSRKRPPRTLPYCFRLMCASSRAAAETPLEQGSSRKRKARTFPKAPASKKQRKEWNRKAYLKATAAAEQECEECEEPSSTPATSASAFARTKGGKVRPASAVKMAQSRKVTPVVASLLRAGGPEQQAAAVRLALDRPELDGAAALLGLSGASETTAALDMARQTATMLGRASASDKARGNVCADQREFQAAVHVAIAPSPVKAGTSSQRAQARLLKAPQKSFNRQQKQAIEKRRRLTKHEHGVYWARMARRKGYSKISPEIRAQLLRAFLEHEHVIVSPVGKDTLKVKDAEGVKQEVPKVLHQVGLGEIFSDLLTDMPALKGVVGERSFRYIISATGYVRRFKANHMMMCGCTDCVGGHSMQASLNGWRAKMKRA
eukprot:7162572-Prymnesium_polylepis.1